MEKLSMEALNRKSVEECITAEKHPIIVILENIRSAYNVGSVFRTADAFLLHSLYLVGYTAKPPHKEIKKTALGAEDAVTWHAATTTAEAILQVKQLGYKVFAVEQVSASIMLQDLPYAHGEKIAVIMGNEVSGVEEATIALCDGCIEIPQYGMKHSLNIATAAGVVLWELVKKNITL